jgi:hypothetical protein
VRNMDGEEFASPSFNRYFKNYGKNKKNIMGGR